MTSGPSRRRLDYVALSHVRGRAGSSARRARPDTMLLCIRMWRLLIAGTVCVLAPRRADAAQGRGVAPIRVAAVRGDTVRAESAGPIGLEGVFDVGGHKLYLRCEGRGAPTVVYLHGLIVTRGGSQSSGLIPGYLRDQAQVCIYDRANVGFSEFHAPARDTLGTRVLIASTPQYLTGAVATGTTHPSATATVPTKNPDECDAAKVMLANGRQAEFETLKAACLAKGGHL